ncbi:MAG: SDR family oxidoreductase [Solirubrobacteraceae bacterium]
MAGRVRLYITGATGYLGSEVARQAGWVGERVEVLDADAVYEAVAGCDAVIHTAYRKDDARVNVEGSANVARAAAAHGARLVHMSTDLVYAGDLGRAVGEDDPVAPLDAYGQSKALAEWEVAAACPSAVLVRTSLIYGGAEPAPHERMAQEPGARFYEDEIRCPIQVGDLAAAVLELAERPEIAGPLNVAGSDAVTRWEFASLITGRDDLPGRGGRREDRETSRWTARARRRCCAPRCGVRGPCSASRPSEACRR